MLVNVDLLQQPMNSEKTKTYKRGVRTLLTRRSGLTRQRRLRVPVGGSTESNVQSTMAEDATPEIEPKLFEHLSLRLMMIMACHGYYDGELVHDEI